ncbi:MAG: hypothetical protein ACLFUB_08190 [Cyclobacteriaceae bacterium]
MQYNQDYWSDLELRIELLGQLEGCSLHFKDRLRQILMDMRLYQESWEALLSMVSRLMQRADFESQVIFLANVERVAFDTRLAPQYTTPLVTFLKEQQSKKAV